jgi:hypothetical protein
MTRPGRSIGLVGLYISAIVIALVIMLVIAWAVRG